MHQSTIDSLDEFTKFDNVLSQLDKLEFNIHEFARNVQKRSHVLKMIAVKGL